MKDLGGVTEMEAIIPSSSLPFPSLLFTPPSLCFYSSSLLFFLFIHFSSFSYIHFSSFSSIHFSSLHLLFVPSPLLSTPLLSTSLLFLIPLNLPAKYASSSCVGARDSSLSAASTHLRIARTGIYL